MHCSHNSAISTDAPAILDVRVVNGSGGGPDKTILNSPRFLHQEGYRMLCGYMHPPGDRGFDHLRARAQLCGAPLISIPDCGPWDWRVILRLLHICRRERVRIWHGHDYKSNLLGLILRRLWPMRLVTTVHGWVTQSRRTSLYFTVDRLCLPAYDHVLCVSGDLHEQCLSAGVRAERCHLLENAIDLDQYARSIPIPRAKEALGCPAGRFLVGAVGRLAQEKGFDLLIRAVARLVREGHDLALIVVGEGEERAALQELIVSLGMAERIRLLGYRSDPIPAFEAMDLFVLSSHREGLPNVLLEAMAIKVPIVATRVGGVAAVIRDQQDGILISPGNVDEIAAAIVRLMADPQLRSRLADEARRTVEQRYSFASRMQKLGRLYHDLLARTVHDYRSAN